MNRPRTAIFVGAGTAGHIEPALAVARAWKEKFPNDRCIFIGTPDGLENRLVPAAGFELQTIDKVVLSRTLNFQTFAFPFRLFAAVRKAKAIVAGADVLIGFGGYASAAAYLAARWAGVPFVIHEANAKVGWANRLGSRFTPYLAIARPIATGRFSKALVTGIPLRPEIKRAYSVATGDWRTVRNKAKTMLGWKVENPTLLVIGGSLGSTFINAQILAALPFLSQLKIQILHSVGGKNLLPQTQQNYQPVTYIDDMATAYLAADLMIARSGAVTCAEFGALGKMAIFIPLPIGNGEQARNADYLVEAGRAVVIPQEQFSLLWLEKNLPSMLDRSNSLSEAGSGQDIDAEQRIIALMGDAARGLPQ